MYVLREVICNIPSIVTEHTDRTHPSTVVVHRGSRRRSVATTQEKKDDTKAIVPRIGIHIFQGYISHGLLRWYGSSRSLDGRFFSCSERPLYTSNRNMQ